MKELIQTADMMTSEYYKERFKAEYWQTKIRYEKLKTLNTKIEAARMTCGGYINERINTVKEPSHDCPAELLMQQQHVMGEYLHVLELRAVIEGINLEE